MERRHEPLPGLRPHPLRALRSRFNLTARELAEASGLVVQKIYAAEYSPWIPHALRNVYAALGVDVEALRLDVAAWSEEAKRKRLAELQERLA